MMYSNSFLYQYSRFVVNVFIIKVTQSIIGLDNSSYTSIQSDVSFGISGKNQKVRGIWTPADPVLYVDRQVKERLTCMYTYNSYFHMHIVSMCIFECVFFIYTLHTTACMTASNPPSGASLFLDTCCFFTSSVKRSTFSVSDSTCLNPNWAWHCRWILCLLNGWRGNGKSVMVNNQFSC